MQCGRHSVEAAGFIPDTDKLRGPSHAAAALLASPADRFPARTPSLRRSSCRAVRSPSSPCWSPRSRPPLLPPRRLHRPAPPPTVPATSRTSTSRARTASGTARNRRSKVWYTIADGVLSDVYFPTNDNTNVETLQYVVTDGKTFTDLQTRDMTYTVEPLDDRALGCRVTATAKSGRYRIVTDYVTDPERATVVDGLALRGAEGQGAPTTSCYVRFDPTLNGNGGGGRRHRATAAAPTAARSPPTTATPCSSARTRSPRPTPPTATTRSRSTARSTPTAPFRAVSNGFAGTASDGLTQLDAVARA